MRAFPCVCRVCNGEWANRPFRIPRARTTTDTRDSLKMPAASSMTVAQLRKELGDRGLDTTGLKAALVARYEEALASGGPAADAEVDAGDAAPAAAAAAAEKEDDVVSLDAGDELGDAPARGRAMRLDELAHGAAGRVLHDDAQLGAAVRDEGLVILDHVRAVELGEDAALVDGLLLRRAAGAHRDLLQAEGAATRIAAVAPARHRPHHAERTLAELADDVEVGHLGDARAGGHHLRGFDRLGRGRGGGRDARGGVAVGNREGRARVRPRRENAHDEEDARDRDRDRARASEGGNPPRARGGTPREIRRGTPWEGPASRDDVGASRGGRLGQCEALTNSSSRLGPHCPCRRKTHLEVPPRREENAKCPHSA